MPRPSRSLKAPATDAVSLVDNTLLTQAYRKVMNKETLTRSEREALKRHEKQKEERLRWQYYHAIPQKHWRQMSGRQTKVINDQAARYGIPFGGPTIDLPSVVIAFHDFLAENAQRLARDDDAMLVGGSSPALERYREERAMLARLDRLERQGRLLPRDEVRKALGRIAAILRDAGDTLLRQFGSSAVEILHEALDDAQREIAAFFGESEERSPDASDAP